MEEQVWNYSNGKLYSLFRDNHFIKCDEEPPFSGQDKEETITNHLQLTTNDIKILTSEYLSYIITICF